MAKSVVTMKPLKAWAVLSDAHKLCTCQTVFCPDAFAWSCFETRAQAEAFARKARKKGLCGFPTILRVKFLPATTEAPRDVPLNDIRELLDD